MNNTWKAYDFASKAIQSKTTGGQLVELRCSDTLGRIIGSNDIVPSNNIFTTISQPDIDTKIIIFAVKNGLLGRGLNVFKSNPEAKSPTGLTRLESLSLFNLYPAMIEQADKGRVAGLKDHPYGADDIFELPESTQETLDRLF